MKFPFVMSLAARSVGLYCPAGLALGVDDHARHLDDHEHRGLRAALWHEEIPS